ncbi:hypothetical protein like AT1G11240 [Hibiscus trionum]|uniref:Nucleolar protein 12 n=1 Tax=Hibiscus trionum TaxID=183268 RepID=A0A9W7I6S1_HIBTR|nr:hypothetical protein like AT1G11240 [Hibiscus trionum]
MGEDYEVEAPVLPSKPRGRHIKKRALKNKALSVSFNEKDLMDYVTGFHKRKKKRRKEAQKKQEQAERRKRIELRKKLFFREPTASVSGTTKYDGENMTVTVITSEISREEEDFSGERTQMAMLNSVGDKVDRKQALPVSKSKPFKKVAKHRSKPPSKRDGNKGKKRNKNRH